MTKSQVERLVDEVASAGDDLGANRAAVARALVLVLGAPDGEPGDGDGERAAGPAAWPELVRRAAERDGWEPARAEALLADGPGSEAAALEAMWDVVAELNERRDLGVPR